MKCLINNNLNRKTLIVYTKISINNNLITNVLAIKACINTNNFTSGLNIIDDNNYLNQLQKQNDIQLMDTLINYYCHFNHIDDALNIFNTIKIKQLILLIV